MQFSSPPKQALQNLNTLSKATTQLHHTQCHGTQQRLAITAVLVSTPTNRRRRRPSPIINPVALILVVPIIALLILFFLVPPFLSHTTQILRPNSDKKRWDSLNIVLVLFAILCGVFARRNDQTPPSVDSNVSSLDNVRPRQSAPAWMHFPDHKGYNNIIGDVTSGGRLKRSSSSYPDLRQESLSESGSGNGSRFPDDFQVNSYRNLRSPENSVRRPRRRSYEAQRGEVETLVREMTDDKFKVRSAPPQPAATLKRRRSVHSVPHRENADEAEVSRRPKPTLPPEFQLPEVVSEKVDRKKSGATKEISTTIVSLYKGQGKRKKRGKSRNIYETATHNSSVEEPRSAPPPPPPPPPPPSKLLQNLFKKNSKSKRVHSIPTTAPTPPPPPPLPPNSIFNSLFKTVGIKSKRSLQPPPPPPKPSHRRHLNIGKPPKPTNAKLQDEDNKVFIAPPSPLIPPPPPPPPFRMTRPRFVAQGDFVRIRSAHSSRGSSPELEDFDVPSVKSDGGDSVGPSILCPSPDVNVKADTFIARLRGEWRLEKINSVKEKRVPG